jgi:phosphoglycolate phosphatase-like HAD superfamily hydrolase
MSDKRLLLLDFDGVIADTFHIAHGIAKRMCVYLTETEYRKRHDGNIYESDKAALAADHGDRCDHALDWLGEYTPVFKMHARPFEGMPEQVKEFARTYTLCIVSSGHNALIEEFLTTYGIRELIDGVYGMEVNTRKDEKFKMIFSKYGIAPEQTVFITDTLGDVNEATSVGLSSIGVTWGFQDRKTLARGNPFAIVDTPQELPAAVADYFASREL